MIKKTVKLQVNKTNNPVNIPKIFIESLGWKDKENLEIILKGKEIIIRKAK